MPRGRPRLPTMHRPLRMCDMDLDACRANTDRCYVTKGSTKRRAHCRKRPTRRRRGSMNAPRMGKHIRFSS